jgi:hypothetical protein
VSSLLIQEPTDEPQQLLLLRTIAAAQESGDLDVSDMAARGQVRLMADEHGS